MRFMHLSLFSAALALLTPLSSFADTPPVPSEPTTTWECPQADGTSLYTNKEKAGCRAMVLKPLSVVPSLEHMPTIPRPVSAPPPYQMPASPLGPSGADRQQVPDWARDWYARIAPSSSVQEEVCSLYSEWLHLVQKTRGGFFFGTDPNYGGDVTGRNQRGPSYSFYDNARYIALNRIFGTGFVPIGCP
ncbi:hypothetical protein [Nitrospira moscoviensis]|uniref:Exported protein n=1 Tax=Nitrospira moscoviensis TaxID=42253 RepID=A0A0K2GIX9_NITMO|nr:hypothetical protein [Nitrospira moscoviensis]ALA60896.1 Exported protein [Nitrospira moscoviensis]